MASSFVFLFLQTTCR